MFSFNGVNSDASSNRFQIVNWFLTTLWSDVSISINNSL